MPLRCVCVCVPKHHHNADKVVRCACARVGHTSATPARRCGFAYLCANEKRSVVMGELAVGEGGGIFAPRVGCVTTCYARDSSSRCGLGKAPNPLIAQHTRAPPPPPTTTSHDPRPINLAEIVIIGVLTIARVTRSRRACRRGQRGV